MPAVVLISTRFVTVLKAGPLLASNGHFFRCPDLLCPSTLLRWPSRLSLGSHRGWVLMSYQWFSLSTRRTPPLFSTLPLFFIPLSSPRCPPRICRFAVILVPNSSASGGLGSISGCLVCWFATSRTPPRGQVRQRFRGRVPIV